MNTKRLDMTGQDTTHYGITLHLTRFHCIQYIPRHCIELHARALHQTKPVAHAMLQTVHMLAYCLPSLDHFQDSRLQQEWINKASTGTGLCHGRDAAPKWNPCKYAANCSYAQLCFSFHCLLESAVSTVCVTGSLPFFLLKPLEMTRARSCRNWQDRWTLGKKCGDQLASKGPIWNIDHIW